MNDSSKNQSGRRAGIITPFLVGYSDAKKNNSTDNYVNNTLAIPEPIQRILVDYSTAEFIDDKLRPNFNLSDDQLIIMAKIISNVLIGNTFIGDMPRSIQVELRIDLNQSKRISDIIVGQLFAPAINEIKDLQRKNFADRLSGSQSPQQQTQSSQTINLRQPVAAQQPQPPQPLRPSPAPQPRPEHRPAPPMDPIIASLKQQGVQPRPVSPPTPPQQPPRPPQGPPPQGQFPTRDPGQNQQSKPQRQPQNVFKVPDINFDEPQTTSGPKQINNPNVLDLREQEKQ